MVAQFPNQQAFASFDIRNFQDQLETAKEKNKYICPVVGGITYPLSQKPGSINALTAATKKMSGKRSNLGQKWWQSKKGVITPPRQTERQSNPRRSSSNQPQSLLTQAW